MIQRTLLFLLAILALAACGSNRPTTLNSQTTPSLGNGLPTLIFFFTDN